MILFILGASFARAEEPRRNILILSSEDSLLTVTRVLTDNIVAPLRDAFPANLTIFTEFMDSSRAKSDEVARESLRQLSAKYGDKKIDLAFAIGPQALELLLHHRDELLPAVPVVFAGIRGNNPLLDDMPDGFGGITTDLQLPKTLDLAVALQPDLRRIILVSGGSAFDRAGHDRALAELASYERQLDIVDLAALPMGRLLDEVSHVQPHSAILFLSMFQDGDGNTFVSSDVASRITAAASAPVYGLYPTFMGYGIVGGYFSGLDDTGSLAAEMALPLLQDLRMSSSLVTVKPEGVPQVDWRVMQRWVLDEDMLPAESHVLFRQPSLWSEHWPTAIAGLLIIAGQFVVIFAFWRQKRERQKAEASLRQVNAHIEIAAATANLGLWSWCPARDSVWMTPRCRQMLGVEPGVEIDIGLFLRSLAGRKQDAARDSLLEAIRTGGVFQGEFRLTDNAGAKHWLSAIGHCIRNEQGRLLAGTVIDVTERHKAQVQSEQQRQQLIHLTRVAVLGELSGALAHELNQPLTAILSNAQTAQRLLARASSDPAELQEILADIVQDDHRAGAVLSKLRTLIRKEEIRYAELDLNQIVDEVLNLVHSDLIERRIHVETDLHDGLPSVRGDRVQIQQVLINLVRNACDAMTAAPDRPHRLFLATNRHGNDGLAVTVADNGGGVPTDLRDRLFEPFVTTKSQGLGLGLTISRSILSAHGGKIWCENNPAGGAVFAFSLPLFERNLERGMAWAS
jgi:C4-dicarboxylate-specific signal transduction histidine kinase